MNSAFGPIFRCAQTRLTGRLAAPKPPGCGRTFAVLSLLLLWPVCALSADAPPDTCYLFCSFRNNGQDGLHLAWSADGMGWQALNHDRSLLQPQVGKEKLMRDPCITQGPDGTFHMVWTDSWTDRTIGYASSKDLITWSEQRALPVMASEPTARNCWAPEVIYDAKRRHFLIYWSTTIPGRFPATEQTAEDHYDHRIYAITTQDFLTFTPTRLFFDPGFNVIDATILRYAAGWVMIFKDETKFPSPHKNLRLATADDLEGPYAVQPEPVTPPNSWVEGPTAIDLAGELTIYCDAYTAHHYEVFRSRDLKTWQDVSPQVALPPGTRHGTVLRVPRSVVEKLQATSGPVSPP